MSAIMTLCPGCGVISRVGDRCACGATITMPIAEHREFERQRAEERKDRLEEQGYSIGDPNDTYPKGDLPF